MRCLIFAGDDFVDRGFARHGVLDRVLGGRVVVVVDLLVVRCFPVNEHAADADEIFGLLSKGEVDAFALSRDQLNAMAKKIPGTRVLDETFKQTVTAVAVPLNHPLSLDYASKFMTEAKANGLLRKAFDNNGLKDTPLRAK